MEIEDMVEEFAARLKEARKLRGMSIRELSEESGVGATTIWTYEQGEGSRLPALSTIVYLADALDVSIEWLVGR
jgi:transcriptional regulator with XRE-family HTH domain